MWKITVTHIYIRSAHELMSGFVVVSDTIRGQMTPYLGSFAGFRVCFLDIGRVLGNKASEEHRKLDSSGRFLLIMWACASP